MIFFVINFLYYFVLHYKFRTKRISKWNSKNFCFLMFLNLIFVIFIFLIFCLFLFCIFYLQYITTSEYCISPLLPHTYFAFNINIIRKPFLSSAHAHIFLAICALLTRLTHTYTNKYPLYVCFYKQAKLRWRLQTALQLP